ncbi:kunitz-type serine protease inhibitor B1-like [Bombyx mandarina]|uniref:Kunitz-type serine protease inhibitor B1-like n=1 Tax=Bombyx mandarina TaxID=7092 RepID=A0A6J2JW47_BOMMA|nr:kunitz-type serine protease inhibitor B1-like [Bombyx mandarina]
MRVPLILLFLIYAVLNFCNGLETYEICYMKIDPGKKTEKNKSEYVTKYAYDLNKRKCVKFPYSGYGGNVNRFDSLNECVKACDPAKLSLENYYKAARSVLKQRKHEED